MCVISSIGLWCGSNTPIEPGLVSKSLLMGRMRLRGEDLSAACAAWVDFQNGWVGLCGG
jgi:hypothetical protein